MKLYFYDETGDIIERIQVSDNIDASRFIATNESPKYQLKDGFYGKLVVENKKLAWRFIPIDPERDLSNEEITQMFAEVL